VTLGKGFGLREAASVGETSFDGKKLRGTFGSSERGAGRKRGEVWGKMKEDRVFRGIP